MNEKNQGVKRGRSGRPQIPGNPIMKSVKLSAEHWEIARRLGKGNMAAGIRRALDDSDFVVSQ